MGVIWGLKILKGGYLNDMIIEWGGDGMGELMEFPHHRLS